MSEMRSEFFFGFASDDLVWPELPIELGTLICETVRFDFATLKAKAVASHEVINIDKQTYENYPDSSIDTFRGQGIKTLANWDKIKLRNTYIDPNGLSLKISMKKCD